MKWLPAGLPEPFQRLARALDGQFAPLRPVRPARLPAYAQADLTARLAEDNPYGLAINIDTKAAVISVLNSGGTAWEFRNVDGSAL